MNEVELMTKKASEIKAPKMNDRKPKKTVSKPSSPLLLPGCANCLPDDQVGKEKTHDSDDEGNDAQADPWILDINALKKEARDFPYKSRVSGYGMTTYQNIECGEGYMIKFGCSWNEGPPGFFIYIGLAVLIGDGYDGLDFSSFEKAYGLIKALKKRGYSFTVWDSGVECELDLGPKAAQSSLNELKSLLVEVFGEERHASPIHDRYSYKDSEWDLDESEWESSEG